MYEHRNVTEYLDMHLSGLYFRTTSLFFLGWN